MKFFDIAIFIIFFGFCWFGFWRGLIQTLGSIVGIFLGAILASRWYDQVIPILGMNETPATRIIVFILLFILIVKLTGLLFQIIHKSFKIAAFLPGLKTLNRFAGLVLGAVEGALFLGVVLNFIKNAATGTIFEDTLAGSVLVGFFVAFASWIVPLFPKALRKVNDLM